mgnify:CR=1 FL=1
MTQDSGRAEKAAGADCSVDDSADDKDNPFVRALELQTQAASEGFDWDSIEQLWPKVNEELDELRHEVEQGAHARAMESELGDVLFMLVNLARWLQLDPWVALQSANNKFARRYAYVQLQRDKLIQSGAPQPDLETLERFWQQAKQNELNT